MKGSIITSHSKEQFGFPKVFIIAPSKALLLELAIAASQLADFEIVAEQITLRLSEVKSFLVTRVTATERCILIVGSVDEKLPAALASHQSCLVIRVPFAKKSDQNTAQSVDCLSDLMEASSLSHSGFSTVAIGKAGCKNAALLAVSILALRHKKLAKKWATFRANQTKAVLKNKLPLN